MSTAWSAISWVVGPGNEQDHKRTGSLIYVLLTVRSSNSTVIRDVAIYLCGTAPFLRLGSHDLGQLTNAVARPLRKNRHQVAPVPVTASDFWTNEGLHNIAILRNGAVPHR